MTTFSCSYDEDLSDNPFLICLREDYPELFSKAISEQWLICVPKKSDRNKVFSHENLTKHILVPNEEVPVTHFRSLFDREVRIIDDVITMCLNDKLVSSRILFRETCYDETMQKFRLICIDSPLDEKEDTSDADLHKFVDIKGCVEYLWTEVGGQQLLKEIEEVAASFNPPVAIPDENPVEQTDWLRDKVSCIYTKALQIAIRNPHLQTKYGSSLENMGFVRIAVQTYLLNCLHKKVLGCLTVWYSSEDSFLNKRIRNAADIQLEEAGVLDEFRQAIPKARADLARIEDSKTPLGKLDCLKKAFKSLLVQKKDNVTDELLPAIIFVMLNSNIPNWMSQLQYITKFRFQVKNLTGEEDDFILITFEAAIEHIRSGKLLLESDEVTKDLKEVAANSQLLKLFDSVALGNVEAVTESLETARLNEDRNMERSADCHPLCNCDSCVAKLAICNSQVTVDSTDDRGYSLLHMASICGQPMIVELLLSSGAKVYLEDRLGRTPIHYAASKGHQNALLLLLYAGSELNPTDFEGNTPLHLAASNGHLSCVKALIYFSEHRSKLLNLNVINHIGDTALHLASRWGFVDIVRLLLENHAENDLRNKKGATASQCAQNTWLSEIINQHRRQN